MNITTKLLAIIICLSIITTNTNAQVVLQLEKYNNPRTEKFYPGYKLDYKEKYLPKEWQKRTIIEIIDNDQIIVFEDGVVALKDIIAVRRGRPFINYLSKGLYIFGANWFVLGGLATLADKYEFDSRDAIIGGTAFIAGWVLSKFYYKTTKLNNKNRLRILDLSWPERVD